jgi:hypothetical protein
MLAPGGPALDAVADLTTELTQHLVMVALLRRRLVAQWVVL